MNAPRSSTPAAAEDQVGASAAPPSTIAIERRDHIALVTLARPEVHNAFNAVLIRELTAALETIDGDTAVRAVVLKGAGRTFCAGADLNWMRETSIYTKAQNLADARALAHLLHTLDTLRKPTVACVHGAAYGGGVGLVACCDIALASRDAVFALSEAKLGIIPATISPYVIEAIGARQARRFFLSCERFSAVEAMRIGLVHDVAPDDALDARVNEILAALLLAGPAAQRACKELVRAVAHRPIDAAMIDDTAQRIATVRATPEGKEGIAAFLEKRPAAWVPDTLRKP
ncbi:MAG: enoyl-CoA hydratase/isomerase family protein [Casimicrobiaceae bacterium]